MIDIQENFNINDETAKVIEKIKNHLDEYNYDFVVATKFVITFDSPYSILLNKETEKRDEINIVSDLKPFAEEIFVKSGNSAFNSIRDFIRINNISKVYLTGFNTECCVLTTANSLFDEGIECYVYSDLCASAGCKDLHDCGLKLLKRIIGKKFVDHSSNFIN